ncbi:U4/U6-U5 snRNP complex subunit prp31 [Exophiala xenobiotica]|uniref:U4/U6-U5 snRNP complex subunit prp31 n=1 Tax=Vermiconidia calcicola TaxID=1690605 RepID=A0AAV9QAI5_9PEZI|nr:U4/U6-U5 snRNP complex subunit prp31 [Exophiala xenobiotica]KAK5530758.1 U4/U6-U5 snRNP complex subunit prp31 [Chaetothyriales sp. CCFEE 6169]KAK5538490.1 U4/U6-U5 snRNP complex subunit prp31 [Vermiconidia calcicola]KAK5212972.1 U4/U6-U5 snRNP complex subunit prp31 [Exophiala xenobiotica]KAK5222153.1 U4/U6-U5 snRNP complex subunit prp31 [Exophiala xenobiotica]
MSTLADELLNDFEDSGDENEDRGLQDDDHANGTNGHPHDHDEAGSPVGAGHDETMEDAEEDEDAAREDMMEDEDETKAKVEKMHLGAVRDVRSVAGLMKILQPVLDKISHYQNLPPNLRTATVGTVEDDPEYHLLTQSNSLSTQIDNEIILVHKFIRDHYSARFPELETLVQNPLDYAKTVAIIRNGPLENIKTLAESPKNIVGASLRSVLDGPTLMVVTVEGTTTKGQPLSDAELEATLRACQMVMELDKAKKVLTEYVQSRMNIFAPNLTAIIGSLTAAQLLNFAGGIKALAKVPDRNIPAMGSRKQKQSGLATNIGIRQQGFLYHSPLIQSIPNDLKIQAMRIVSAKLVLAARVDSVHQAPDGSTGEQLRDDCLRRLDKLTEPPPNRGPRALPAPDDKPSRKRGGRRARKAKEATAMTELRKQQNRMAFGSEEKEAGYGMGEDTVGLGMIGQSNDGRIRATQIDRRTMAKLSKKNPGWGGSGTATTLNSGMNTSLRGFGMGGQSTSLRASGLRTSGVGAGSGTASSIAFTPVQGLELVDPKVQAELKRKREAENAGYFSSGTFTQANAGKSGSGFKMPSLPPAKKTNMGPPPTPKS